MHRICLAIFLFVPFLCARNFIFNPGFDLDPWYTGWTIVADSGEGFVGCEADTSKYISSPQSCLIWVSTGGVAASYLSIYQEFTPVCNCTCSFYFCYNICDYNIGLSQVTISVKVNGEWQCVWTGMFDPQPKWIHFYRVYGPYEVVSGIKFTVGGDCGNHGGWAHCELWIDDVRVTSSTVAVEEGILSSRNAFKITPNPFKNELSLEINYPELSVSPPALLAKVFDPAGRLVKTLSIDPSAGQTYWDGTDFRGCEVSKGMYIIKLENPFANETLGVQKVIKY